MKLPVNGLWSSQQLSWLGALGLRVYTRASLVRPTSPQLGAQQEQGRRHIVEPTVGQPVVTMPMDNTPLTAQRPSPIITQTPAHCRQPRSLSSIQLPDRLQLAMLKACACDPSRPDIAQLMLEWRLDDLRTNPQAKRLLWPRLRRLRRQALSQ